MADLDEADAGPSRFVGTPVLFHLVFARMLS
jgi:hypothetical protein